MRVAAKFLSIVLHPLFMPFYTMVLAFRLDPHLVFLLLGGNGQLLLVNMLMVFVMTAIFPLVSCLLFLRAGVITHITMPTRQERIMPFTVTLFYYGLTFYMLHKSPHHPATYGMLLGAMVALALTLAITLRWKISVHMVGIGGLLGALSALLVLHGTFAPIEMAFMILLAGALGTARLLTSDHTAGQVHAGAVLGFASTFLCVLFYPA